MAAGGDKLYTHLTCPGCNRRIYGSTEAINEKATWLSDSESGSEGGTRCASSRTA